jgi:hypothetical protein
MFVPSGSRLTWVGSFGDYSFYNQTSTDAVQQVAAGLRNKYSLFIEATADHIGAADFQPGTLTLTLRTDMDRGNGSDGAADIKSNVDDEFALQGNAPTDSTISLLSPGASPSAAGGSSGVDYSSCTGVTDYVRNALPTWLGGTPVTEAQQTCYTKQSSAQIKSVATNAAAAGYSADVVKTATDTANAQAALGANDIAILSDAQRAAAKKQDESQKNWLIAGAVGVGALVLLVVLLPYTRPVA